MRCVRDELPLPREGVLQTIEHAVEGPPECRYLARLPIHLDAAAQLAGVHLGGDRRDPAQRARDHHGHQRRDHERERERERSDEQEDALEPLLRLIDAAERVRDPQRPDRLAPGP